MEPYILDDTALARLQRHAQWWQRKASLYATVASAPLGPLWLPLSDGTLATEDMDVAPEMLDLDRLAGPQLEPGLLDWNEDQIRTDAPYSRVPWVEAIVGAPVRATIQGGSMRTRAGVRSWADWRAGEHQRDQEWLARLTELTDLLVARSAGRYAVVQTLMRGPSDLAEAMLGPELMSYSLVDHGRELRRFLEDVTDVFIEALREQLVRIPRLQGGYVNPFGIWAPGTVVRTQCDATAFLSRRHYAEWFLPYDVRICEAVDYSIIHLHSCSLHIVDALLAVERPHAIQVTLETGPNVPSLKELVPVFRRILAQKPVIIDGPLTAVEVRTLQEELPSGGRCILARQTGW